jgi:hypothetical protein
MRNTEILKWVAVAGAAGKSVWVAGAYTRSLFSST